MSSFRTNSETLRQLEFTELLHRISDLTVTVKGRQRILDSEILLAPDQISTSMAQVFESWKMIKEVGPFVQESWKDLTGVDSSWTIQGKVIPVEHLLVLKNLSESHDQVYRRISEYQASYPALFILLNGLMPITGLIKAFRRVFDDLGEVSDSASADLAEIRREIRRIQARITTRSQQMLDSFSKEKVLGGQQLTIRNGRLVLPVLAEHKRKIKGFIHDISGSGQTVFIEPQELVDLNNDLQEHRSEEKKEIHRILSVLSEDVRHYASELKQIESILVSLDQIHARAGFLLDFPVIIPGLSAKPEWNLCRAVHPLLFLSRKEKGLKTIPLDLQLGNEGEQFIIISGPNAGGKSVAMKTAGLLQLMVQSGMPVPAAEGTVFPVMTGVFSVIGDSQSISDDLSSFSGHIRAIREVLVSADLDGTLVLVDEICSGTDPVEGQALAIELIETFIRRNFYGIVTSHFPGLKSFAHDHPGLKNGSMVFDTERLVPTYEFRKGIPGSSFALELAGRMQLDDHLIRQARERLGPVNAGIEKLNFELESRLNDLNQKTIELEKAISEARKQETRFSEASRDFRTKEKELKNALKIQLQNELESLRRQIFQQLEELKKERHIDFVKAEKTLTLEVEKRERFLPPTENQPAIQVKPGEKVRVKSTSRNGEVISADDQSAVVLVGNFKLKIPLADLEKAGKEAPKNLQPTSSPVDFTVDTASEIHLLGLTVHEALDRLDFYLSKAYYHKLPSVRVVHGKGTGALRKAVQQHLAKLDYVDSFQLGEWFEGSTGVTVVKFRK